MTNRYPDKLELYLSYGSNLNHDQMHVRCPSARFIGCGMLQDYKLVFRNVADIEKSEGSRTPVGIWLVDEDARLSLDRYEGAPRLYRRVYHKLSKKPSPDRPPFDEAPLKVSDVSIVRKLPYRVTPVFTYIMSPNYANTYSEPSYSYYSSIVEGYKHCGLEDSHSLAMSVAASAMKSKQTKDSWFSYLHNSSRPQRV